MSLRDGFDWASLIGNALVILVVLAFLVMMLISRRMPFRKKLRARRAKEQEARRRRSLLEQSVRAHLPPALIKLGFEPEPSHSQDEPGNRKYSGCFPSWGRLTRSRDSIVDKVEIQFSSYGRAAFRINATPVPKDGMMTAGGHRTVEEVHAGGLHDHFETHARSWLRPTLKALRAEPLGEWFSLWPLPLRLRTQGDYDKLALRATAVLTELDIALREGKLGPHIRRLEFKRLPPEVLERIKKLNAERALDK